MCMVDESPVVDMRSPYKVQAVAVAPAQARRPKIDDDLSVLPASMRKNLLASMNRNRDAFAALAKL
jgi:hypothetical protein